MNVIITMAGEGSRFSKLHPGIPKHMIEVRGRTLFSWSLTSLLNFRDCRFIFVARKSHGATSFIEQECGKTGISDHACLELERATSGQAETALAAKELTSDNRQPVIIYNIDTFVEPAYLRPEDIRGDGWIPVFEAEGDKWSFCKFGPDCKVTAVTEKRRISEFGTVGLYYFSSFDLFEECYQRTTIGDYPERFVAPMYDCLVKDSSRQVFAQVVPSAAVHVLGTPEDISNFQYDSASMG